MFIPRMQGNNIYIPLQYRATEKLHNYLYRSKKGIWQSTTTTVVKWLKFLETL